MSGSLELLLDCGSASLYEAQDPQYLAAVGVAGVRVYTGSGRPSRAWIEGCIAAGVGVEFIQERYNEWAQGGASAAAQDLAFAESRMYGAPSYVGCTYAVSDGSWSSPGPADGASWIRARAGIVDYCYFLGLHYPRDVIDLYGNIYCIDAGIEGLLAAGFSRKVTTWVPCYWFPRDTDTVWQYGHQRGVGIPPPIDGTDSNYVKVGTAAELGMWGLSAPEPIQEDEDMYVGWGTAGDGSIYTAVVDGGITTLPFGGTVSPFGFYQDGYDYAQANKLPFRLLATGQIDFANLRNFQVWNPPAGGGGGGGGEPAVYDFSGVATPR